ncbi:hypothetical protein [Reyranella soli]|uniref:hypothetical protein n=1 Tax=Reyranella soli TaxID=1230389 RepID=UPI0014797215|nr:hypothetical protein [Reyranella soli]
MSAQSVVSYFEESLLSQIVVSFAGILVICAATWFKSGGSAGSGRTPSAAEAVP